MSPIVSVILPVYNCPQYVGEAIQSILDQSFTDFELILIDDGSTDETPDVLVRYADPRIRLLTQKNHGLAATLNNGIGLARGRFIARQDQDDWSLPGRFAKQVAFLDSHPGCGLVGTWAQIWYERTKTQRVHQHPCDASTLKFELLFNNPFVHSSVMIRRTALDRVGIYCIDRNRQPPEDYELWSRIAHEYDLANIPEVLHVYRETRGSMSRLGPAPFVDHLVTICAENIAWWSGFATSDPQVMNLSALTHGVKHRMAGEPDFSAMHEILRRAVTHAIPNDELARFEREADGRVNSLQYRYWEMDHSHPWRRHFARLVRRLRWLNCIF